MEKIKFEARANRLKTLEDKVKFIMKHSCFVADVKIDDETLQDLWDEENEVNVNRSFYVNSEPTVKEEEFQPATLTITREDGEIIKEQKLLIKRGDEKWLKVSMADNMEDLIKPIVKECDCEKRGDFCSCPITELYNDGEISLRKRTIISGKPTVKCMCGEQTTFGEADVEIGGVRHRVKHPCYVIPTDKSEKIEEIISGVRDKYAEGYFNGHTYFKMFESWLRDKLKNICK